MDLKEILSKKHEFAREVAMHAHNDAGQYRIGTGERYHKHPEAVSDILEAYGADDIICSAASLHDTLEDTELTYENLINMFGKDVADLVNEVTNSPDLDGLNKEDYMSSKLLKLSDDALVIKLGDMIHNCLDNPRLKQMQRMKNNIEFLKRKRKQLNRLHKDLIETFFNSFYYKLKVK